ncbi:MAG: extracellular solute-binding protein [Clostridia bacterium]|nr:extracellular solute-binding protein [Clostridia bacterium]
MKRKLSLVLAMVMILTSVFVTGASATGETQNSTNTVDKIPVSSELPTYEDYMSDKGGFTNATADIVVDATNYASSVNAEVEKVDKFKPENGEEKNTVVKWTNEDGTLTYNINVPADGLYTVKFLYYALPGRNNPVAFGLKLDGKYLFEAMKEFELSRLYKDEPVAEVDEKGKKKYDEKGNPIYQVAKDKDGNVRYDAEGNVLYLTVRTDGIGNEFAAEQTEYFAFQEGYFVDPTGLESMPYTFALTAGTHTVELESVAEPVALDAIVFGVPEQYKSYSEVSKDYDTSKKVSADTIKIEGEDAALKNGNSLVAQYDQTDPSVSSVNGSNPYLTRINYIGDVNWASPGQRITWKVNVPEAGYYKLAYRYKQSHVLNGNAYRKLMVNGKVPFAEAASICFNYDLDWQHSEFADENGNPYLIYFNKGVNTISMEVNLGDFTATVRELKEVIYKVGNIYRDMIKVTGESPDSSRDYNLFEQIPQFNERLTEYSEELYRIAAKTEEMAGQAGGTNATTIRGLCEVLDDMVEHKWTAHQYKTLFYNNYTSVSALVYSMMEMGLNIDYIEIGAPDVQFADPAASWWAKTSYSIQRFFSSFSADYNNISGDLETDKSITIWANWGRDQIRVLNNLIQSSFTPETGIGVNLKMSNASYVNAILSGKAPDCSLNMARSEPVNLALRGSMVDLSQFPDFDEVMERFMTADAVLPFSFDNDSTDDIPAGVYALPDTLNFYMLFYRTDIFEEFGVKPPKTWDEYLQISALFNRNNLQASLPYTQITTAAMVNAGVGSLSILPTFIMQMGGEIYKPDGSATELSSVTSIKAFEFWTDFFNEYKFPVTADFFNRFRIGTMPMGVQNYTMYIQLTMAAPEITGKWKMVPIPGFKNEDGTINNCQAGAGTGCGILKVSKNHDLGWEFLKWWTRADTQLNYSNNCESILGVSGRVATSNPEALKKMGWDKDSLNALLAQWKNMKEVPEIPGSYYTARSIDQAYWNVVNNSKNAKDMMIKWAEISDAEIERKRNQYNVK